MYKYKLIYNLLALLAFVAGFLFSFWLLCLFGLLLAAALGQYAVSIILGLLMDTAYGAPVGRLHGLHVPFTLLSLVVCGLHYYLSTYVRKGETGRL